MEKTILKFKFVKPAGIAVGARAGSYYPHMTTQYKEVQGAVGRFPFIGYDFDEEFIVELPAEKPRPLPSYLTQGDEFTEDVKRAYLAKQMESIQAIHDENNLVRDRLNDYEKKGIIVKTYDSLYEKSEPAPELRRARVTKVVNEETDTPE